LCPVCLKKLEWNCRFDTVKRYEKLKTFYGQYHLKEEAASIAKRLAKIERRGGNMER
jgi:hypothetical protein